jgi:hypothetical protein
VTGHFATWHNYLEGVTLGLNWVMVIRIIQYCGGWGGPKIKTFHDTSPTLAIQVRQFMLSFMAVKNEVELNPRHDDHPIYIPFLKAALSIGINVNDTNEKLVGQLIRSIWIIPEE